MIREQVFIGPPRHLAHRRRLLGLTLAALAYSLMCSLASQSARGDPIQEAQPSAAPGAYWVPAGQGGFAPERSRYNNSAGQAEVLYADGPLDMAHSAFFEPLGSNGRGCVTCHQPASGMGLSVAIIKSRWTESNGHDPLFAAIDGSNCPSLPQDKESSHSLLLDRGLFRVSLPWPPKPAPDGTSIQPEFTIEVVRDPTSCNTDPLYGLKSAEPHVSVFRRPRVVANLKYVAVDAGGEVYGPLGPFNAKRLGMVMDRDPESGRYMSMNIMSDARAPTLTMQAQDAARDHLQVQTPLTQDSSRRSSHSNPRSMQPRASIGSEMIFRCRRCRRHWARTSFSTRVRESWGITSARRFSSLSMRGPRRAKTATSPQQSFRDSVSRGYEVFFNRPFWIGDVSHINTVRTGQPRQTHVRDLPQPADGRNGCLRRLGRSRDHK